MDYDSTAHNEQMWTEEDFNRWNERLYPAGGDDEIEEKDIPLALRFAVYTIALTAFVVWLAVGVAELMLQ